MFKTWTYKGVAYQSEWKVRQEVFNQDRVCFGEAPEEGKVEFWAQFGVAYTEEEDQPTPEPTVEEKAAQIRSRRDRLIEESDFYMMPDYPATEKGLEAVKNYRQALRDVTLQEPFPHSVQWPEVPAVLPIISKSVYRSSVCRNPTATKIPIFVLRSTGRNMN